MRTLTEHHGKTVCAMTIDAPGDIAIPFSGMFFPCMVWDHDGGSSETQRSEVAGRLLDGGCRYVVCGGKDCEAWHDAVDDEIVRRHGGDSHDALAAAHVMTTWHADESPDEVAWFFVRCTNFDDHVYRNYLVLHVGDGGTREDVDAAVRRHVLAQEAV